jgi:trimeric autotransporter adhesin
MIGLVTGMTVDSGGNLYLADLSEAVVRMIDPNGTITSFAGVGYSNPGTVGDGSPAVSTLLIPNGVAFDGIGSIYISDIYLSEVDRVDLSTGLIYTVAGNGTPGFSGDKGVAIAAELYYPAGLAAQGSQIYIADLANTRVRKVANNVITTVAGTGDRDLGPATAAFLNLPEGLAIDSAGNIAVADTYNYAVRRFKAGGAISAFGEVLGQPFGITVDQSGNFYLSDSEPLVLKIGTDGTTATIAGNSQTGFSGDSGSAQSASLNNPSGVAVDAQSNVYIADNGNHRIRKVDPSGIIQTIAGNGKPVYSGDNGPALAAGMDPFDLALDKADNLLVVDRANNRIRKIAPNGTITTVAGTGVPGYSGDGGPATAARLNFPAGIALDSFGNLYIADEGNFVVRRVTSSGLITTIAGTGVISPSSGDGGPASAAQLDPWRVAVDGAGNLYVTDSFNDRVRLLTPLVVKPANATKVSGDNQSATVGTALAAPIVLKIADANGNGVPGVIVVFTVSPANAATVSPSPAITLNDGTVSATVTLGKAAGPITIQASATGVTGLPVLSFSATALPSNAPAISSGGITSAGLSTPPVQNLAPNAIVSIFGSNFAPAGTAREVGTADLVDGKIPTNLAGVCVEFDGQRAPIFDVFPGQLNVQVPSLMPGNTAVQVITNCDTSAAVASPPIDATVQAAAPEFFYFAHNTNGQDPIAAVNAVTGAYVGAPGLIAGATFVPAQPGDILTLYATGFGATNPAFGPGELPGTAAPVTAPYSITFGGVTLDPSDILYVGATQDAGLYQVNLKVPSSVPDGNQPLVITVGGVASPSGAFLTVKQNSGS